jgi:hypothetical protein
MKGFENTFWCFFYLLFILARGSQVGLKVHVQKLILFKLPVKRRDSFMVSLIPSDLHLEPKNENQRTHSTKNENQPTHSTKNENQRTAAQRMKINAQQHKGKTLTKAHVNFDVWYYVIKKHAWQMVAHAFTPSTWRQRQR